MNIKNQEKSGKIRKFEIMEAEVVVVLMTSFSALIAAVYSTVVNPKSDRAIKALESNRLMFG